MRILVSNDDGIDAPGLEYLAQAAAEFGEVFIIAPDRERSASSHSLTIHRPLRIFKKGERKFALDGTPTDCVNLGIKEILRDTPPDLVVSGINRGQNVGDDITYSGTVAAALEGALLKIPSMAISLVTDDKKAPNYVPAAYVAKKIIQKMITDTIPADVVLNINVPNIEGDRIDDFEITRMGKRHYEDAISEKIDPRGRKYYWIGAAGTRFEEDISESDCVAVRNGKVSITPIRLDLTHENFFEKMKSEWKL